IEEKIEKKYQAIMEEEVEKLVDKLDLYASEEVANFINEHKFDVTNEAKAKLFDSLFEGLKSLFVEHNVTIESEQVNLLENTIEDRNALKKAYDRLARENKELRETVENAEIKETLSTYTEGMSDL